MVITLFLVSQGCEDEMSKYMEVLRMRWHIINSQKVLVIIIIIATLIHFLMDFIDFTSCIKKGQEERKAYLGCMMWPSSVLCH